MFERADEIGFAVHIGNDKTERGRSWKFLTCQEFQGGGVLVPGTVLLSLTFAGRLAKERYRVNFRKNSNLHTADSGEVNAPR